MEDENYLHSELSNNLFLSNCKMEELIQGKWATDNKYTR